jgi:hypothetical protein
MRGLYTARLWEIQPTPPPPHTQSRSLLWLAKVIPRRSLLINYFHHDNDRQRVLYVRWLAGWRLLM